MLCYVMLRDVACQNVAGGRRRTKVDLSPKIDSGQLKI